jgi:predicted ATPase
MKAHITNLGLENFRVFKDKTDFEFAPITILTGTNSSGKSSLISAMEMLNHRDDQPTKSIFSMSWDLKREVERPALSAFSFTPTEINRRFGGFNSLKNLDRPNDNMTVYRVLQQSYSNEMFSVSLSFDSAPNDSKKGLLQKIEIKLKTTGETLCSLGVYDGNILGFINYPYFLQRIREIAHGQDNQEYIKEVTFADTDDTQEHLTLLSLEKRKEKLQLFFDSNEPFFRIKGREFAIGGFDDFDENASAEYNKNYSSELMSYCNELQNGEFSVAINNVGALDKFKLQAQIEFLTDRWFVIRQGAESIDIRDLDTFANAACYPIGTVKSGKTEDGLNNYYDKIIEKFEIKCIKNKKFEQAIKFIFCDFIWGRINNVLKQLEPQTIEFVPAAKIQTERVYIDFDRHKGLTKLKALSDILLKASKYKNDKVFSFFHNCLRILGSNYSFHIESGNDASSSMVYLKKGDKKILLADAGFGVTQYLHVLAQVIITGYAVYSKYRDSNAESAGIDWDEYFEHSPGVASILVIEEPEAHLHPALQSKLADLFVEAAKTFGIQFIIETHSEYLIRKLQYLTGKGEIKPEDTVIYYFYPPDHPDVLEGKEPQVKRINILADGGLDDNFGEGFFDEATHWKFELLSLNNSQRN